MSVAVDGRDISHMVAGVDWGAAAGSLTHATLKLLPGVASADVDIPGAQVTLELRLLSVVGWFAQHMENELQKNDSNDRWLYHSPGHLVTRLRGEVDELFLALPGVDARAVDPSARLAIVQAAADVANFAMMIADHFGLRQGDGA